MTMFYGNGGLMKPKNGWYVPPVKGLLEPVSNPTSKVDHTAVRAAVSLIDYEPNNEPRKPKKNPNAVHVENHWRPEHDLPPEVLAAFKPRR